MPVNHQTNAMQTIAQREEHWVTPGIPDGGEQKNKVSGGHVRESQTEWKERRNVKHKHKLFVSSNT